MVGPMTMTKVPKTRADSKYNDQPGTGRTGMYRIPPNNYDFYTEDEKYKPQRTAGGGILSEWEPIYQPSTVKADAGRLDAFGRLDLDKIKENRDRSFCEKMREKYPESPETPHMKILVTSELHRDEEYGGPFWLTIPSKVRVHELRMMIAEHCGVMPGLQRLKFAAKDFDDPERNLEHMGVKYWHGKFPDWPIVMKRF